MSDSSENHSEKVSLEELLRFKRAERPDQKFWDKFDQELHQRMMRTLVRKDPWPVQVLRGLSGRIAQNIAIAGTAAVLGLMVVRPAFVPTVEEGQPVVAEVASPEVRPAEVLIDEADPLLVASADYGTEALTVATDDSESRIVSEYGLDHIVVVNYDREAYSADLALPSFASTGVASIVY